MSHFTVTVCLPGKVFPDSIQDALTTLMARWDENRDVESYRDYEEGPLEELWDLEWIRIQAQHYRDLLANGIAAEAAKRAEEKKGNDFRPKTDHEELLAAIDYILSDWEQWARANEAEARFDADPSWKAFAAIHNELEPDERPYLYDADADRVYQMSTRNEEAKWDYWVVGGRWRNSLHARPGVDASALIIEGPHWSDQYKKENPEEWAPNGGRYCDGGPKWLLDFASMRDEAEQKARDRFATWAEISSGYEAGKPWSHFVELAQAGAIAWDEARAEYGAQPVIEATRKDDRFGWDCPIDEFACGLDEYAARARMKAVPGFALVTLDGEWLSPGRMGWWAMTDATEGSREAYGVEANAYLESLPDDTIIVQLDCHI